MPPSAPSMAIFQRGGNFLQHRLTKLYSDTKQSCEKAAITAPTSITSTYTDPDVEALRREFQIQQDRLLAWGLDWADTNAAHNHDQNSDVDIDKKLDKAGLGDIVADVMSDIQRLLEEAGSMQRPTKKSRISKESKVPDAPDSDQANKRWTWHEITESRSLLDQLKNSLDILYKVTESKRTSSQSSKLDSDKANASGGSPMTLKLSFEAAQSHRTSFDTAREDVDLPAPDARQIQTGVGALIPHASHYIEFESMNLTQGDSSNNSGLPLYEEAMAHERSRLVGTLLDELHGENILFTMLPFAGLCVVAYGIFLLTLSRFDFYCCRIYFYQTRPGMGTR